MAFEILSKIDGSILFHVEAGSLRVALEIAVKKEADLSWADLSGANLREADLSGANLSWADLSGANLSGADLREADLSGANLRGADLREADLSGANLREADLSGANLSGADLREADLSGANLRVADLREADLSGANLRVIRDDIWAVLSSSPSEVDGLRMAILEGRINGSSYEGDCACLVGTLANARGVNYRSIPGLIPDSSRPAEVFFDSIRIGNTPANSQFSRLAIEWVDLWLANIKAAFTVQS